ncbi:MAG: hypothetical protein E6399_07200 [Clostridium sp.]|uniref:hypothetical protein n=1 Tax=Clostridium sp. TaxID=1506 RepID=UPI0029102FE2|nr:hypothetical protein [Clostridium sp.]MDU6874250.1 hypothetical protein [Clostridium sp.]
MNLKNKAESERLKEALLILNGKLIRDKDIELAIQDFNDKFDKIESGFIVNYYFNMNVPGWAIFFLLN